MLTTAAKSRLYDQEAYVTTVKEAGKLYRNKDKKGLEQLVGKLSKKEETIERKLHALRRRESFDEKIKSMALTGELRGMMETKAPITIMLSHLENGDANAQAHDRQNVTSLSPRCRAPEMLED